MEYIYNSQQYHNVYSYAPPEGIADMKLLQGISKEQLHVSFTTTLQNELVSLIENMIRHVAFYYMF